MKLTFLGAAGAVTGSCYLLQTSRRTLLLECGQIQGRPAEEALNRLPLPVPAANIGAVVLSHAHIDHSGRLPLLHREGYDGPIYTHDATRVLCAVMLRDSAYLHEKDAEWENRKRRRKGMSPVKPLYTQEDAAKVMDQFVGLEFAKRREILPGVELRLHDAGHILGSAIVELSLEDGGERRTLVFSGDLGYAASPVMNDPTPMAEADLVLLESTYGDRNHRSFDSTLDELRGIFRDAAESGGNVLIPAFAVGRTQDLLYLMAEHYGEWRLDRWQEVNAKIHTVGGLSAHADQAGLVEWYDNFKGNPPVYLVHGEDKARLALTDKLQERYDVEARRPKLAEVVSLT